MALEWLEPAGPDSALQWGFFDSIFEQKEYGEAYVLESLAREMMAKDPKLKAEFEKEGCERSGICGECLCAAGVFL